MCRTQTAAQRVEWGGAAAGAHLRFHRQHALHEVLQRGRQRLWRLRLLLRTPIPTLGITAFLQVHCRHETLFDTLFITLGTVLTADLCITVSRNRRPEASTSHPK